MATLYITEFRAQPNDASGVSVSVGTLPPVAEQTVTFTTTTASAAFNANTRFIRVQASANCSISVGSAPTATSSNLPLAAGATEYFGVLPGDKIAAVAT